MEPFPLSKHRAANLFINSQIDSDDHDKSISSFATTFKNEMKNAISDAMADTEKRVLEKVEILVESIKTENDKVVLKSRSRFCLP